MAETTADVRRDIELTRERMSTTLTELEHKLNVTEVVREHPWPALALAVGAGVALGSSHADAKAAVATVAATKGASSRIGVVLDDLVANLMTGVNDALQQRLDGWVSELKGAIGAPRNDGRSTMTDRAVPTSGYGIGPMHGTPGAEPGTVTGTPPRAD